MERNEKTAVTSMKKKKKIPEKLKIWVDARKRFHLSHAQVQMARELGLNPKKFGKYANHKQEAWKEPLPDYIETLYYKHFKKHQPDKIRSIEQIVKDRNRKKEEKKQQKNIKKNNEKKVYIIAGPNDCGKTTFAREKVQK